MTTRLATARHLMAKAPRPKVKRAVRNAKIAVDEAVAVIAVTATIAKPRPKGKQRLKQVTLRLKNLQRKLTEPRQKLRRLRKSQSAAALIKSVRLNQPSQVTLAKTGMTA